METPNNTPESNPLTSETLQSLTTLIKENQGLDHAPFSINDEGEEVLPTAYNPAVEIQGNTCTLTYGDEDDNEIREIYRITDTTIERGSFTITKDEPQEFDDDPPPGFVIDEEATQAAERDKYADKYSEGEKNMTFEKIEETEAQELKAKLERIIKSQEDFDL